MPGTVLGTGNVSVNKKNQPNNNMNKTPALKDLLLQLGRQKVKKKNKKV